MMSLVFEDLEGKHMQRPDSFLSGASIGNMTLRDGSTPGTLFPLLLSAKQSKDMKTLDRETSTFFKLEYEQNPLEKTKGDHFVAMEILPVEYVHNPGAIKKVVDFFARPESESQTIDMIKVRNNFVAATDTI